MTYRILRGDVLSFARHYHGPLFHACLCDPPYHLTSIVKRFSSPSELDYEVARSNPHRRTGSGFMGSHWDGGTLAFEPETWVAFSELLYPGAFLMAFASSRGWHRMACAIEDAGFSIMPSIFGWLNSQSFPKATRIDSRIEDKELAKDWVGHRYGGQVLKNALEPIIVSQKPYVGKPIDSITTTGAGALNIDAGRIRTNPNVDDMSREVVRQQRQSETWENGSGFKNETNRLTGVRADGRWPANLILQHSSHCKRIGTKQVDGYAINRFTDGAKPFGGGAGHEYTTEQMPAETIAEWECVPECPVRRLGEQSGERTTGALKPYTERHENASAYRMHREKTFEKESESGTASRFFYNSSWEYEQQEPDWNIEVEERLLESDPVRYESKASTVERNAGLSNRNIHPTLKPLSLCKHLASLLLPPDRYSPRRLLVPFSGVASEMAGALLAGWNEIIGVEGEAEYSKIGRTRL